MDDIPNVLKIKTEFDLCFDNKNEGQRYNQQIHQIRLDTRYNGHIVIMRPSTLQCRFTKRWRVLPSDVCFYSKGTPDLRKTFAKSSNLKKRWHVISFWAQMQILEQTNKLDLFQIVYGVDDQRWNHGKL